MNLQPIHPIVVHLPIALAVIMPLLSVGVLIAWWRRAMPRRVWWIVAALQLMLVGGGVVALRTGAADEHRAEQVVAESHIEAHEEAAEVFVGSAAVVLMIAIAAAAIRNERLSRGLAAAASVGTLAVLFLGYRVGEAGGRLVYQDGAATAYTSGTRANLPSAAIATTESRDGE